MGVNNIALTQFVEFPTADVQGLLPGSAGFLEAAFLKAKKESLPYRVAIVCHPHPLFEGTFDNKVVTTVARTFRDAGIDTWRFNFRGVGHSEGSYGDVDGEIADLKSILNWIAQHAPEPFECWLAGFSFGSYITARVAAEQPCRQLVSIAPPVHHFAFQTLPRIHCPWLIIQGAADEVVPPEAVYRWVESREEHPILVRLPGVGHYFHHTLGLLKTTLQQQLNLEPS